MGPHETYSARSFPRQLMCMLLVSTAALALPFPKGFVALNSSDGLAMLFSSDTLRSSYEQAAVHLVTQFDEGSCSRASATVVLNAMSAYGVGAPVASRFSPFGYWTQDLFTSMPCVAEFCTAPCTLSQAARAISCVAGIHGEALHASDMDGDAALRKLIVSVLSRPGMHVIANFDGAPMNSLQHFGHFSPVVAYHQKLDMALVLDVSRYKYPPWWVPIPLLWRGMNTVDTGAAATRGALIVRPYHRESIAASNASLLI